MRIRFSLMSGWALLLAVSSVGAQPVDGNWTQFSQPGEFAGHVAIYDRLRDRMVVVGSPGFLFGKSSSSDVWMLNRGGSAAWVRVPAQGSPPPLTCDARRAVYDPVGDRLIVTGAPYSVATGVWALSFATGPTWTHIVPAGTPPASDSLGPTIYDPIRKRILIFGGSSFHAGNDVWELTLGTSPTWTRLTPAGARPSPRMSASAIYDPVRDRMVVFGGSGAGGSLSDAWALSLAGNPVWSPLTASGTPGPRYWHTAIYDPAGDRMLVFGGYAGDVWALTLGATPAWSSVAPSGGPPHDRWLHTAVYDSKRAQMIVFGGKYIPDHEAYEVFLSDTWVLSLTGSPAWSRLQAAPEGRSHAVAFFDPRRDRIVLFGGTGVANESLSSTWALAPGGIPAWSLVLDTGTPRLDDRSGVYDPVRDRMVVTGSYNTNPSPMQLWALSFGGSPAWTDWSGSPGEPAQSFFASCAMYDPVRDRMLVYASPVGEQVPGSEGVWAVALGDPPAWTHVTTAGAPPPGSYGASVLYDPVRDRMLVFIMTSLPSTETWQLSLAGTPTWSRIDFAGTVPSPRRYCTVAYDARRDRVVLYGGRGPGGETLGDVWALSLSGTPTWNPLNLAGTPPNPRQQPVFVADPQRDRMILFGGTDSIPTDDVWSLEWEPVPVSVPGEGRPHGIALATPSPNPATGDASLEIELSSPGNVTLDVFDTLGRRVQRLANGRYSAGPHAIAWRRADERGNVLTSGVYYVRLEVAGQSACRRVVRLR